MLDTTTKFSCSISTTNDSAPLDLEILLNDKQIFKSEQLSTEPQAVEYNISDTDAEHELKFVMRNKHAEHTKIGENGVILSDTRIIIDNLLFDEISVSQLAQESAVYTHDYNGSGPETQDKFYGELGCNGVVSFKFTSPIYLWILKHLQP